MVTVCRSFRNTGTCKFGFNCKYEHSVGPLIQRPTTCWQVSGLPAGVTVDEIRTAVSTSTSTPLPATCSVELFSRGGNAARPFCFLAFAEHVPLANNLCVRGSICAVRQRKAARTERVAAIARGTAALAERQAKAKASAATPLAACLKCLPVRDGGTLEQHTQMASLPPASAALCCAYLERRFSAWDRAGVVAAAMRLVWERHPTSLKAKELFETAEAFALLERRLTLLGPRRPSHNGASAGADAAADTNAAVRGGVDHIFDMACGHGMLGVLLALRFPGIAVTCVDLFQRPCFEHYVEAFRAVSSQGKVVALSNLRFVASDIAAVKLPPRSFVAIVHACNEASRTALTMARAAGARFGAMPCCIRKSDLYPVRCRRVDDETRHAIMVGVMAEIFGAHTIVAIDRRITNGDLTMFG